MTPTVGLIVYSTQKTDFLPGYSYANPRFFNGIPRAGVVRVVVIGDWPEVVAAYRKAGIEVIETENAETAAILGLKAPELKIDHGLTTKQVEDPGSVEIPEGWRDLQWPALRHLASSLSAAPITNKKGATEVIEAELARRSAPIVAALARGGAQGAGQA